MKKSRFLAFLVLCALLLSAASMSVAAEEAPKLYFNLTFDDLPAGAISKNDKHWMLKPDGTRHNDLLSVVDNVSVIENRWGDNNCLTYRKEKDSTNVTDIGLFWQNSMKTVSLATAGTDFVIQWDMYVDCDDGGAVYVLAERSQADAWRKSNTVRINQKEADGTAPLSYTNAEGTPATTSVRFHYGKWSRFAAVFHHETATLDLYLDGVLAFAGAPIPQDSQQVTLGKFMTKTAAPADCTLSMDNIRMYSGSKPLKDAELGIAPTGTSLDGVQFSAVNSEKYGMRMVGTVDSLDYDAIGIDMTLYYTENDTAKTKAATKQTSAVYDSILATKDGKIDAYTAEHFGGKYLWALTLDGIPTAVGEMTVDVDCWSIRNGVKTVQSRVRLVVANGKLLSCCAL